MPLDPSILYEKNGNIYPDRTNYWFRITANYPLGESVRSNAYMPTIPNTLRPATPTGTSYTNGNGTGYADFKWDAVTGATGYKIWMWNGAAYESLDVGNVTSWTTKGKKYWPTTAEISAGKYALHLDDNAGAELPLDPALTYANAGTAYANTHHYYIRVSAYNDTGESVYSSSYFGPTISSLSVPKPPTGRAYTNMESSNSGYVVLNWDKITGAEGYKVWVYNGKDYESYDVKDVDTWTTQNKGIWPSQAEIDGGMKNLHHPDNETDTYYGGEELPLEPFKLYAKNGTTYATSPYYYFRISAYDGDGETIYSSTYFRTPIGQPVPFLGTEEYWSFIDVPYGKVNVATGNLIVDEEDYSISGRGPELGLNRTYNSMSTSVGLFGPGWHSDLDMKVTASSDNSNVTLVDEDGTLHQFAKVNGVYEAPTGVYLELTEDTDSYILKSTDQSESYFSKGSGKLTKIVDGYGNTLKYTYDTSGKLTTITDASLRHLDLKYDTNGYVTEVSGPDSRKVSYVYQNGFLTKVTQTAGEVTSYGYVGGKLNKVYEPNHAVEKPIINQYIYDGDTKKVIEVQNPKKQKYVLDYDTTNKQLTVTSPKGNKDQYTYNDAANPTKVIEDVGGLNITSTFNYEGNNLVESKDPNAQNSSTPTEKYTYDGNGNVLTAKDSYGTETYEYNSNNDVTSAVDTEGDQSTIAYDDLDAVSETDQNGKTSSIAKYQKESNGISNGNLLESSYSLSTATNLLTNNSFESDLTGWSTNKTNDTGTLTVDTTTANNLSGTKSLKISAQSTSSSKGFLAATQELPVEENKQYTLSGLIKTDVSKGNAFFNVLVMDANGTALLWTDNRYSQVTGNRNWTERQLSFKTPANAVKIRVYLEIEHYDLNASGSAWFDNVQLEKAEVSSSYNPSLNSSFNGLTNWTGSGGSNDTATGFEDSTSLKIARTATTQAASEYKQTVVVGQSLTDAPFNITLTGLSKADNVVKKSTVTERDYSIVGKVTYTNGEIEEFVASFPIGTQDWNRTAVKIPGTKPINKIEISTVFKGNYTGTVWFDAIRVMKGAIITKNKYDSDKNYVTETEDESGNITKTTYDANGNKTSEIDAKGQKQTFEIDNANQLKSLLLANGTMIRYLYDLNGNMKSKTIETDQGTQQTFAYQYDENDSLTETVGPLSEKTSNEYDEHGNNIKTVLPNGHTISSEYDGTDRVKNIAYNGETAYGFTYDKNGNVLSVNYSKEGRSKTRSFDSSDRIVKQEDRGGTQEWKYATTSDKLNEFIVKQVSLVQQLTYQYNELDQNTSVNDGEVSYRFDYDERGNVKTYISGNGSGSSFKYDDRGLMQQVVIGLKEGAEILDETYSYDQNGNRTSIKYPDGQSVAYEYDEINQLEKETLKDGTMKEYSYDGFGNRQSVKATKDGSTKTTLSEYNVENQLTKFASESIKYDLNGNRTEDGKYIYKWNEKDQLESITKKGESTPFVSYKYDEGGRRIEKTVGSTITNYFYVGDSLNVLYETNGENQVTRTYIYSKAGQLLAMKKGTEKYFYHFNAHGDVIALTDKTGKIVATYEYDAWGNLLKTEEDTVVKDNPYRYAGYQYDTETGYYYLIARYYQPIQGVFLSLDPDPGNMENVSSQNGYNYADNNPIMSFDYDGHSAQNDGYGTQPQMSRGSGSGGSGSSNKNRWFSTKKTNKGKYKGKVSVKKNIFGKSASLKLKASDLRSYAKSKGWKKTKTSNGPEKWVDKNGIARITIKGGSSRAPGSAKPHVEIKNSKGQRIDPMGNPVTRKSKGNHTPIIYN